MTFVMFDTVTVSQVPSSANAVAGYVNGRFANIGAVKAAFPKAHHLSISVRSTDVADCLDIEPGDSTPSRAAFWVELARAHGIWRPCLYANRSTMPAVVANLKAHGIARSSVRLWVADWTLHPHIPPGFDACQWTDRSLGRNLDESLCLASFFKAAHPSKPPDPPGPAKPARYWEAKVAVDEQTGHWTVSPLPGEAVDAPAIIPGDHA